MAEYWESRFKNEGAMWQFEPSDSALIALDTFKSNHCRKILIPGAGYGRNAKLFIDAGFEVTGIEISASAIELAKTNGLKCLIHHGSVTNMPFDNELYDGIFCYALIHLLNKNERRNFLNACNNQLKDNGIMFFAVATKKMDMYGTGKCLSKDRYEISKGLKVFFYGSESLIEEFYRFGIIDSKDIDEPVKFMKDQGSLKMKYVVCKKSF